MKVKDLITLLDKNDFNYSDPFKSFGGYVDEGYYVVCTKLFVDFLINKGHKIKKSTLKERLKSALTYDKKSDILKKLCQKKLPSFNYSDKRYTFWKKKNIDDSKMLPAEKIIPPFPPDFEYFETSFFDDPGDINADLSAHGY